MTSFIIIVVIALFIVLVGFTWYRLEAFEWMEKIIICVAGILICWGITNILFSISASGMDYINAEIKNEISKILVLVFTPINGIVLMPYVARIMSQIRFEEIEAKDTVKKIVILAIIFVVICFIEVAYLKNIQSGIFDIVNKIE